MQFHEYTMQNAKTLSWMEWRKSQMKWGEERRETNAYIEVKIGRKMNPYQEIKEIWSEERHLLWNKAHIRWGEERRETIPLLLVVKNGMECETKPYPVKKHQRKKKHFALT